MSLRRFREGLVEREPVEGFPEVLAEPAFARASAPRHLGEVQSSCMCKHKFHGLDEEGLKDLLKFVWPERDFEIISLSWVRGLMIVMLNQDIGYSKLVIIKHLPEFFKHFFHLF